MEERIFCREDLVVFRKWMLEHQYSEATTEKYVRNAGKLIDWLGGKPLTIKRAVRWKNFLLGKHLKPSTINGKIASANAFFKCFDMPQYVIRTVGAQRRIFRDESRHLSRQEYETLVAAARRLKKERLALLFETICGTGIRVSEVMYITVEAAQAGSAQVYLKGKIRAILITKNLSARLLAYAKENGIASGPIFLSRYGTPLSRKQIWADMKSICGKAGVDPKKVYPHNLRHLFAREYYETTQNVVQLADVLGHSNMSTTRIYLITTEAEQRDAMERMRLVS